MINEELASLILFANIEPADNFWAYEIDQRGAEDVYQRIISGNYYLAKPEILKLKDSIIQTDVEKLQIEINNSGSSFITQASPDWPTCLADLAKPPIGLIIRRVHHRPLIRERDRTAAKPLPLASKRWLGDYYPTFNFKNLSLYLYHSG